MSGNTSYRGCVNSGNASWRGTSYYCPNPECKSKKFILRKSGKTGKGSRRPHFSHVESSPNCTPEGVLHYSFKRMLINFLVFLKNENKKLVMNWNCDLCNYRNSVFLLQRAASIKEEYNLKVCRPDIALLDENENVYAVIEIVVKHNPEEQVLQYYKDNKIVLIQINLSSDEDLKKIGEKIIDLDHVDFCISPKCQNNDKYVINRKIKLGPHRCGFCFRQLAKFYIVIDSVFGNQASFDFTDDEINFVKSKYNNIEIVNNKKTMEKYPKTYCGSCKSKRNRNRPRF